MWAEECELLLLAEGTVLGGTVFEQQIENIFSDATVGLNAGSAQFNPQLGRGKPPVRKFELHVREPSVSRAPRILM